MLLRLKKKQSQPGTDVEKENSQLGFFIHYNGSATKNTKNT